MIHGRIKLDKSARKLDCRGVNGCIFASDNDVFFEARWK